MSNNIVQFSLNIAFINLFKRLQRQHRLSQERL